MTRDDEIFAEALDLPTVERPALLDRACGDDLALRARVEALLAGHAEATHFLDEPIADRPSDLPLEKPGDTLGRYTLLQKLGEGGCGIVYLAEQKEPVRRRVALKVIKLGMDTRSVIARFAAERQALAIMDHPGIARVFDAGATGAGRPFFVMELVQGMPLTKYCDAQNLPMPARLELFIRVCQAIQHAHQKGIIHRDIKPSNVLVAEHDGAPAPKVIDFGIAKATQGRLTDQTLFTGYDQFIGTPAYMSPEQAEFSGLDIDTRSDIYSLGVLLYELLTGRTPFDARTLGDAGIDEIRRVIREVDPPRPSLRVSTLGDADRTTVAKLRGTGPANLKTALRGDLDWIVMRCLEKNRTRRYESASALAADVQRHLRNEAVAARPPSTTYLLSRLFRRHRLAFAAGTAILAALVIGAVVSTRQAIRATRAERTALAERDIATLARGDAQRRQEQAEDVLAFMLGDFRDDLKKVGQLPLLANVGRKAMSYFDGLDARDLTDTALARQAKAFTQIGETSMAQNGYLDAGRAFKSAYERAAALAARHPKNGDMLFERAQAEYGIGALHRRQGRYDATQEWFSRYRDSAAALVNLDPADPRGRTELASGQHNLAVSYLDHGELDAARANFAAKLKTLEAMLAADPANVELQFRISDTESWLGTVAERQGDLTKSIAHFTAQAAALNAILKLEPQVPRWRFEHANSLSFQSTLLAITGHLPAARQQLAEARRLIEALVRHDPANRQWLRSSLRFRLLEAGLARATGDLQGAARLVGEARTGYDAIAKAEPTDRVARNQLAAACRMETELRLALGQSDVADSIAPALEYGEAQMRGGTANDSILTEFARACLVAARAAATPAVRLRHAERALEVLAPKLSQGSDWRVLEPAARALALLGRVEESRAVCERLQRIGYHSLEEWPESVRLTFRSQQ